MATPTIGPLTHKVSSTCEADAVRDASLPTCSKPSEVQVEWQQYRHGLCDGCLRKLAPMLERKGIAMPMDFVL